MSDDNNIEQKLRTALRQADASHIAREISRLKSERAKLDRRIQKLEAELASLRD